MKKETERCDGRKTRSWSDVATVEEMRIASELMVLQAQMKKEAKKETEMKKVAGLVHLKDEGRQQRAGFQKKTRMKMAQWRSIRQEEEVDLWNTYVREIGKRFRDNQIEETKQR